MSGSKKTVSPNFFDLNISIEAIYNMYFRKNMFLHLQNTFEIFFRVPYVLTKSCGIRAKLLFAFFFVSLKICFFEYTYCKSLRLKFSGQKFLGNIFVLTLTFSQKISRLSSQDFIFSEISFIILMFFFEKKNIKIIKEIHTIWNSMRIVERIFAKM